MKLSKAVTVKGRLSSAAMCVGDDTVKWLADAATTLRPDLVHYSTKSSVWVARWLVPQILSAAKGLR